MYARSTWASWTSRASRFDGELLRQQKQLNNFSSPAAKQLLDFISLSLFLLFAYATTNLKGPRGGHNGPIEIRYPVEREAASNGQQQRVSKISLFVLLRIHKFHSSGIFYYVQVAKKRMNFICDTN